MQIELTFCRCSVMAFTALFVDLSLSASLIITAMAAAPCGCCSASLKLRNRSALKPRICSSPGKKALSSACSEPVGESDGPQWKYSCSN